MSKTKEAQTGNPRVLMRDASLASRVVDGRTQVNLVGRWVGYPSSASELIRVAYDHGWGVDDGIPVRFLADGTAFIRVIVGREPGLNPLGDLVSDPEGCVSAGHQFRAIWYLDVERGGRFVAGDALHKSSEFDGWKVCTYVAQIRRTIVMNPVRIPSRFAEANN